MPASRSASRVALQAAPATVAQTRRLPTAVSPPISVQKGPVPNKGGCCSARAQTAASDMLRCSATLRTSAEGGGAGRASRRAGGRRNGLAGEVAAITVERRAPVKRHACTAKEAQSGKERARRRSWPDLAESPAFQTLLSMQTRHRDTFSFFETMAEAREDMDLGLDFPVGLLCQRRISMRFYGQQMRKESRDFRIFTPLPPSAPLAGRRRCRSPRPRRDHLGRGVARPPGQRARSLGPAGRRGERRPRARLLLPRPPGRRAPRGRSRRARWRVLRLPEG